MRSWTGRWRILEVTAFLVLVAGCAAPTGVAVEPPTPTLGVPRTIPLPPGPTTLAEPDGAGPIAAVMWGAHGQFATAPLVAIDESGRTLAYGVGPGRVLDVSICPESRKMTVLAYETYDRMVVSVWDLADFEVEDVWPVDRPVRAVRCGSADGQRSSLYLPPAGLDPSPPASAGPTTTVPAPVGGPVGGAAPGSNSWSILEIDHGEIATRYDPGEYGTVIAFTSRWVIATHNTTLWIVDLAERPPRPTVLETTFPTTAAIDPSESMAVVAGRYPNRGDPVRLSRIRLGPAPALIVERATDGSAGTRPLVWLDPNRFIRGNVVYDRDLEPVDSWPVSLQLLAVDGSFGFGVESSAEWEDTLVRVDSATGEVAPAQALVGGVLGIVTVSGGPSVTAAASGYLPQPTIPPPPEGSPPSVPPTLVELPQFDNVDHSTLEELRKLVVDAGGDAGRIGSQVGRYASGTSTRMPQDEIDGCSGVGFAAGASASGALGQADIGGRMVIIYAFTDASNPADATIAAIDPANCEILDAVGSLLTPGPGVNLTTTVTAP